MKCFLLSIVLLIVSVRGYAYDDNFIIHDIILEGNQRVEDETIRSHILLQKGARYSNSLANDSLKKIYDLQIFANVEIDIRGGNTVVFKVKENPLINKIAFEGNNVVKREELLTVTKLKPRMVLSNAKVKKDIDAMMQQYQKTGRYSAKITPKIISLSENRVNLVFEIEEGKKTTIQKIFFSGNQAFGYSKLSGIIKSHESAWYRFLSSTDVYDADLVEYDKHLLTNFYQEHGYLDFNVATVLAEITKDKQGFYLTYVLEEGQQYIVNNTSVNCQVKGIKSDKLLAIVRNSIGGAV